MSKEERSFNHQQEFISLYQTETTFLLQQLQEHDLPNLSTLIRIVLEQFQKYQKDRFYQSKFLSQCNEKFRLILEDFLQELKKKFEFFFESSTQFDESSQILKEIQENLQLRVEEAHQHFYKRGHSELDQQLVQVLLKIENTFNFFKQCNFDLQNKFSLDFGLVIALFKKFIFSGEIQAEETEKLLVFNSQEYNKKVNQMKLYLESKETVLDRVCLLLKYDSSSFRKINLRSYLKTFVIQNQRNLTKIVFQQIQNAIDVCFENIEEFKKTDPRKEKEKDLEFKFYKVQRFFIDKIQYSKAFKSANEELKIHRNSADVYIDPSNLNESLLKEIFDLFTEDFDFLDNFLFEEIFLKMKAGTINSSLLNTLEKNKQSVLALRIINQAIKLTGHFKQNLCSFGKEILELHQIDQSMRVEVTEKLMGLVDLPQEQKVTIESVKVSLGILFEELDDLLIRRKCQNEENPKEPINSWEAKVQFIKYPKLRKTVNLELLNMTEFFQREISQLSYDGVINKASLEKGTFHLGKAQNLFYIFDDIQKEFFLVFEVTSTEAGQSFKSYVYTEKTSKQNTESIVEEGKKAISNISDECFFEEQSFPVWFEKSIEFQFDLKSKLVFLLESLVSDDFLVENGVFKANVNQDAVRGKVTEFKAQLRDQFISKHKMNQEIDDYEKTMKSFNLKSKQENMKSKGEKISDVIRQMEKKEQGREVGNFQGKTLEQMKQERIAKKNMLKEQKEKLLNKIKERTAQSEQELKNLDLKVFEKKEVFLEYRHREISKPIDIQKEENQESHEERLRKIKENKIRIEKEQEEKIEKLKKEMEEKEQRAQEIKEELEHKKQQVLIQRDQERLQKIRDQEEKEKQEQLKKQQQYQQEQEQLQKREQERKMQLEKLREQEKLSQLEQQKLRAQKQEEDQKRIQQEIEQKKEEQRKKNEEHQLKLEMERKEKLEQSKKQKEENELKRKLEEEKLEKERTERLKMEQEKLESQRRQQQLLETQRQESLKLEQEKLQQDKLEKERLEKERLEEEAKLEKQKQQKALELEQARLAKEKEEKRVAEEKEEKRLAQEKEEKRLAQEKEEKRLAQEKEEQKRQALEREKERIENERLQVEKLEKQKKLAEQNAIKQEKKSKEDSVDFDEEEDFFDDFEDEEEEPKKENQKQKEPEQNQVVEDNFSDLDDFSYSDKNQQIQEQKKTPVVKESKFGIRGLRELKNQKEDEVPISIPSTVIQEQKNKENLVEAVEDSVQLASTAPKKGGIRGLKQLAQNNKQNNCGAEDIPRMMKLINPSAIENFITYSMTEHFMNEQDFKDYYQNEEFSLVKLMTLFNDLISNKYIFFFDTQQTQEIQESFVKGLEVKQTSISNLKNWFSNIFPDSQPNDFNILIFLFEGIPCQMCLYDVNQSVSWFISTEDESFDQALFSQFFNKVLPKMGLSVTKTLQSVINDEANEIYEGFFPDYYLKMLSLTYDIFYESCIFDFNVGVFKAYFDDSVSQFTDIKFQRFLLTLISIDQVTQNMENETMEKCLTNFAESVFEDINADGSCFFTRLSNDQEISEDQVIPLCENFMKSFGDQYRKDNLQNMMKIFGYVNLIDDLENKYVYYFQIEPLRRNMIVFRTLNKRKHDRQIISLFKSYFEVLGLTLMFYEDIPRHFMVNTCPEIVLAIAINKLVEDVQFEQILQIMSFNLIPCIIDEEELLNFDQLQEIGDDDNLSDQYRQEIEQDFNYHQEREPQYQKQTGRENDSEVDFDDDDLNFDDFDVDDD